MDKYALSKDEVNLFSDNGWIGPFDTGLDDDLIDACCRRSEEIVENNLVSPLYGRHSVRDWHLLDNKFLTLFKQDQIAHRVKSIFGGEAIKLWRSKIFVTPPKGRGIGWHQEWGHFNGEEIGNNIPALKPLHFDEFWNLSIWVALNDITIERSPMQFLTGSNKHRYEIKMVPMCDSAFFVNPFDDIDNKDELVDKVKASTLLLDINTTKLLDGIDYESIPLEELKKVCWKKMQNFSAAVTLPFDTEDGEETLLMRKGQFVIFSERTMHRSLPNLTDGNRVAINCRMTPISTEVYPGKKEGLVIDGSNLNITKHECIELV